MRSMPFYILLVACSDTTLQSPKSDKTYDDMDDPGQTMNGVKLDAAADALPDGEGSACASPMECAAPLRCIYPIALGCGVKGTCALYQDPPMCTSKLACGCDGKDVSLCSPDGYAPAPVRSTSACGSDAAPD